jgi:hypothetical protein
MVREAVRAGRVPPQDEIPVDVGGDPLDRLPGAFDEGRRLAFTWWSLSLSRNEGGGR